MYNIVLNDLEYTNNSHNYMKIMKSRDKIILKEKPDEVIIYKKRIGNRLVTVHNIRIVHRPFNSKKHWIIYNNSEVGMGTKTQLLRRLRERIV